MKQLLTAAVVIFLSGCSIPHIIEYKSPSDKTPANWSEAPPSNTARLDLREWWKNFNDPVLNQLVEHALCNNLDLKIASQRLLAARADRQAVAAQSSPVIGVSGQTMEQRSSKELDWPKGIGRSRSQTLQLDASWEPDLFGRIRYAVDAEDANIALLEEDRRAIFTSLLAEIAANYIDLRIKQQRLAIAERNVTKLRETLDTNKRLYSAGLVSETSVALARAEMQTAIALLPTWRASIAQHAHTIGLLVGGAADDLKASFESSGNTLPQVPVTPASVPSDVLRARPDVRGAERKVAVATARANVAIADLFPHFRIPLSLGTASSGVGSLFSAPSFVWSAALSGSHVLFDNDRRQARIEAAKAVTELQRIEFEKSIRTALRDVEDALSSVREESVRQNALMTAVQDHQVAVNRAEREQKVGTIDYLQLLIAQRTLYSVEDAAMASRGQQLQGIIALSKALGGGWQNLYPDSAFQ
ncbi:efflux transporter outer membrane subunit [Pseudomonas sp. CFSAN084952]|uniref:efflux transporter outer membrane subunit n=1 Tax=Pseudomonas TaxID=286 RepID=UPI001299804D|nr:efflux transporter outer membrane subunit [Pseudomonas sp. CFSAN084952]QGF91726.1 efflux transporter outer membrane subunit [Pseudomonas sp. CFSAN084952]